MTYDYLPLFSRATFDGDTFDPFLDGVRLESQLSLVAQVMSEIGRAHV